jgi:hypothetical protein
MRERRGGQHSGQKRSGGERRGGHRGSGAGDGGERGQRRGHEAETVGIWEGGTLVLVGNSWRGVLQKRRRDIFSVTEGVPFNQFNLDDLNGLEMAP